MFTNKIPVRLAAGLMICLLALPQAFPQSPSTSQPKPEEAVQQLEPFTVSTSAENGYQSNESLSATRLRGKTKDVASAITTFTPELLNDLGVTSFNELADFVPSSSNYHINEGDSNGNGPRSGPPPTYVRGFRSDSIAANFFSTLAPIDLFNTSMVTFSRGPNSVMFGIGSPGGSVNNPTNRADPLRNSGQVTFRADSFDGLRETIDLNTVIIPKKFALRLDLLDGNNKSNIEPNRNQRTAAFLTGLYKPFESTTVVANIQGFRIRNEIPKSYTIFDWYTPWVNAGSQLISTAGGALTPGTRRIQGATTPLAVFIPGEGAMNWAGMGEGLRPNLLGGHADVGFDKNSPLKVIPLDVNAMGDADRNHQDSNLMALFVTQRLAQGLYLELGVQTEHRNIMNMEPDGNTYAINVDPNAQLPTGAPNPYAGVPYLEMTPSRLYQITDQNQFRGTLGYEKDLSRIKVFGRGLGSFSVLGLYQNSTSHQFVDQFRDMNTTPVGVTNPQMNNSAFRLRWRYYLTPTSGNILRTALQPLNENGITTQWLVPDTVRNDWQRATSYAAAAQIRLLDDLVAVTGGARRDGIDTQGVNYTRSSRGVFEAGPGGRPSTGGVKAPMIAGVGKSYLGGVVLNPLKYFSLFANKSTNYQGLAPSTRDVTNNYLPFSTGRGTDIGVKFFLLGDRISGSFGYFTTEQDNIAVGMNNYNEINLINNIWTGGAVTNAPAGQAIGADPTRLPPLTNWQDIQSQKTHGIEFQLTGNPTKNLRLFATASRNLTTITQLGSITQNYVNQNTPFWLSQGSNLAIDPITNTPSTVAALVTSLQNGVFNERQRIGIAQTQTFIWQTNFVARYQFDRSTPLKGWAIGSANRWRSRPIIGFPSIAYPNTILDVHHPFYGSTTFNLDAWVEYTTSFGLDGHKFGWTTQFRVQNLLKDDATAPWTAYDNGAGGPAVARRLAVRDRQFILDTKITF